MLRPLRIFLLAPLTALVLAPGAAAADETAPVITANVISGTPGSNGWYITNVSITWSVSDPESAVAITAGTCNAVTISTETAGVGVVCEATSEGGTTRVTKTIRLDKTAPQTSGANAARAPDVNGWYNQPVGVSFAGSDALSGIDGCTATTYGGPDTEAAPVSGTCRDRAGHQGAAVSVSLRYDATPPQLEQPAAERAPDSAGWYNHAVKIPFTASDATSGVDSCDAPTYAGPDAAEATVTGTCRDKAGNAASGSLALRYDATAPVLGALKAKATAGAAVLSWQASADTMAVEVTRSPGLTGTKPALVYRGNAKTFRDLRVAVGRRYRYTITGRDVAGNAKTLAVAFRLASGLIRPAPGARVRVPPLLAWKKVAGAKYYNVQVYRGNRKVFTFWPSGTSLRLHRSWTFEGRLIKLVPGNYRWFVWGGIGARSKNRYGPLLGSSTFVMR
jgi:hypothetical protein